MRWNHALSFYNPDDRETVGWELIQVCLWQTCITITGIPTMFLVAAMHRVTERNLVFYEAEIRGY